MRNARKRQRAREQQRQQRTIILPRVPTPWDKEHRPFDPTPFIRLCEAKLPERPACAAAFARCQHQWQESPCYTYLSDPDRSRPGRGGFSLRCPKQGWLIVDLCADGRILGFEYFDRVMSGSYWC